MGGIGSGGGNRLSDEERRKRGTFRPDRTDAARDAMAVQKVVNGPWLREIPPPELPLSEIGKGKYHELTRILFDQNKLTLVTRMLAEQAASLHQEIHRRMVAGKPVPASLSTQMQRALGQLKIAEDAPAIANPAGKQNKFAGCGFSSRLSPTRGLRGNSSSRS
jgi:hypothetical protein